MKKSNLLTAFNLSLISVITGYSTQLMPLGLNFKNILLTVFIYIGIFTFFLMLLNGSLIEQKKFMIPVLLFGLVGVSGIMVKVMFEKGQGELTLAGVTGVSVIYALHFVNKENRGILDFLKAGFVFFSVLRLLSYMKDWPYMEYFSVVPVVLFWLMAGVFYFRQMRQMETEDLME